MMKGNAGLRPRTIPLYNLEEILLHSYPHYAEKLYSLIENEQLMKEACNIKLLTFFLAYLESQSSPDSDLIQTTSDLLLSCYEKNTSKSH